MSAARQEKFRNIVCLLAGSFVYSVGTHCFVVPANIAPGGASGLALMVNFVTGLPVGVLTMVVNVPLLILAWIYLSRKFAVSTAMSCIDLHSLFRDPGFRGGAGISHVHRGPAAVQPVRRRDRGGGHGADLHVRLHHRRK